MTNSKIKFINLKGHSNGGPFAKYWEWLQRFLCKHLHSPITRPVALPGCIPYYYCMKCGRKHEVNW